MATVPSMDTFAAGEKVTAAKLNKNIRDASAFLLNPPTAFAFSNTATSLTNAAYTVVNMDGEIWDTDNMHSTTTNNSRITFKTAGLYHVTASVQFPNNTTGVRKAYLRVNGGAVPQINEAEQPAMATFAVTLTVQGYYYAAVNDYVELLAWHNIGSAQNNVPGQGQTYIQTRWVSA